MLREIKRDETPKNLYNPLLEDFTTQIADDDNNPIMYTLHAQENESFPTYIANRILKRLAEKVYLERTKGKITKESIMPDILKEIER